MTTSLPANRYGYRSRVSIAMPKPPGIARARGIRAPGLAAFAAFCVCQKMAGRPRVSVKTNCERDKRGRSRTRSITAPRRRHEATGTSSTTSARAGQSSSNGWQ